MKERLHYLFLQYLESTASERELEEFLAYIKEARNDQALRDMIRAVYKDIRETDPNMVSYIDGTGSLVLNDLASMPEVVEETLPPYGRKRKSPRRLMTVLSVAVVVLSIVVWGWPKIKGHGREAVSVRSLTKKFTERSEYKFLLLPDSTQVWLNANSSLEFPDEFAENRREVYLNGEAYFDVKHADEVPFIIHTGKIITTVLGTAFNIKAYSYQREVQVSVSRGKVRVSKDDQTVAILLKGQQVRVSNNADTLMRQKNVDTARIAYWQKGTVSYDDETIGDILKDLEQLYNVTIHVKDTSLLDTRMTTSFNRSIGVEQALILIGKLIDQQVVNEDGQYTIQPN